MQIFRGDGRAAYFSAYCLICFVPGSCLTCIRALRFFKSLIPVIQPFHRGFLSGACAEIAIIPLLNSVPGPHPGTFPVELQGIDKRPGVCSNRVAFRSDGFLIRQGICGSGICGGGALFQRSGVCGLYRAFTGCFPGSFSCASGKQGKCSRHSYHHKKCRHANRHGLIPPFDL